MRFWQSFRWRLAVYCLVGLLASHPTRSRPPQSRDFTLQIKVLEALEGGPVAVEASLVYTGNEPFQVYQSLLDDGFQLKCPRSWEREPWGDIKGFRVFDGHEHSRRVLVPGERQVDGAFLHMGYPDIPAGKARLRFNWPVREFGGYGKQIPPFVQFLDHPLKVLKDGFQKAGPNDWVNGKLLAEPEIVLTVDIAPATPENLAALRDRFDRELDRPDVAPERTRYIAQCVYGSRHKEFTPVILKLLDCPALAFSPSLLVGQLYRCHSDPRQADELLLRYVLRPDALWPAVPFEHWVHTKPAFRGEQIQALRGAKNPWVRMLTYVTFPKQCPEHWKTELLAEVGNLAELPTAVENLRRLDDARLQVREEAAARLRAMAQLAVPAIGAYLHGNLAPEVRRLCEQILVDCKRERVSSNQGEAFLVLETAPGPEGKAMLEALAKAPPDCRIAKKAKEALDRLGKSANPSKQAP